MLDCHANAFLARPGKVLGLRLKPLTLRRYWVLEALQSPIACGGVVELGDVGLAAWVLSVSPWFAQWAIRHPAWLAWRMRRLSKRIANPDDYAVARDGLLTYWQAYTDFPAIRPAKNETARMSCLPRSVNIAWALMSRLPERRVWSMPMGEALTYFAALCEGNGREFRTERDKRMAAKNHEALKAKRPANG